MDFTMERVSQMLALLKKHWYYERQPLIGWRFSECGYKTDNRIPDSSSDAFHDFGADDAGVTSRTRMRGFADMWLSPKAGAARKCASHLRQILVQSIRVQTSIYRRQSLTSMEH